MSGEMDTSGVRSRNRSQSLHLIKDMLDINLAGWHHHKMWDCCHKFKMSGVVLQMFDISLTSFNHFKQVLSKFVFKASPNNISS